MLSRRLRTLGETPGSVARGGVVREAARGESQVAVSPRPACVCLWACPGGRRRRRLALLL
jgi:hypothetical protein